MKSIFKYLILAFFPLTIQAQKAFSVEIQFPENINTENIRIGYENGKERIGFPTKFVNNKITVSGMYYSKYMTLWIYDDLKDSFVNWNDFWVEGLSASISFLEVDSSKNIFQKYILRNAQSLQVVGEKHNKFVYAEDKKYRNFYEKYFSESFKGEYTDSLNRVFNTIFQNLNNKSLVFVKENGKSYYAFDYFRRNLSTLPQLNADTLLSVFSTSFPKTFKDSFEGKELNKFLKGKALKKNAKAPVIESIDYFSREKLSFLKGKVTLLVFWASWCKPCVAEIPAVQELRKRYPSDKLNIVYVTLDEDATKFVVAMKKYELNWFHVFGDKDLLKTFGVLGIPQIFLIDELGKIAYSREEEKDFTPKLLVLNRILEEKIVK